MCPVFLLSLHVGWNKCRTSSEQSLKIHFTDQFLVIFPHSGSNIRFNVKKTCEDIEKFHQDQFGKSWVHSWKQIMTNLMTYDSTHVSQLLKCRYKLKWNNGISKKFIFIMANLTFKQSIWVSGLWQLVQYALIPFPNGWSNIRS